MTKPKNKEITRMLHTVADLHVREAGEGEAPSRVITGYAILFDVPSAPLYEDEDEIVREIISSAAVTKEFLDSCDIKLTMFHDRQLILGRSRNGEGTLKYAIDSKGVAFEVEAPNTADGDKAIELIKRGDISGCSFMFCTHYYDSTYVVRSVERIDGKTHITYTVNIITEIRDFTLAVDPAYPDTTCETEAREFVYGLREPEQEPEPDIDNEKMREQVREMRCAATQRL